MVETETTSVKPEPSEVIPSWESVFSPHGPEDWSPELENMRDRFISATVARAIRGDKEVQKAILDLLARCRSIREEY